MKIICLSPHPFNYTKYCYCVTFNVCGSVLTISNLRGSMLQLLLGFSFWSAMKEAVCFFPYLSPQFWLNLHGRWHLKDLYPVPILPTFLPQAHFWARRFNVHVPHSHMALFRELWAKLNMAPHITRYMWPQFSPTPHIIVSVFHVQKLSLNCL